MDLAPYFPPDLFLNVSNSDLAEMQGYHAMGRTDPSDTPLHEVGRALRMLGEESLYARRAEPELHVYRVLESSIWGVSWITRVESLGATAWIDRRHDHHCQRSEKDGFGNIVEMREAELPVAKWLEIETCMARAFWPAPMVYAKLPVPRAPSRDVEMMCDGPDSYLVEGVRGGEYHALRLTGGSRGPPDGPVGECIGMIDGIAR